MHWIDPDCLREIKGSVTQFLLNPHGDIDGLVLKPQALVHVPPHLHRQIAKHVRIGSKVRVRGLKPRGANVWAAVALTAEDGATITDEGPDAAHGGSGREPRRKPAEVAGRVTLSLHGPKGELRGALLEDGTSLRMPPHAADELAAYLAPGAEVRAWGQLVSTPRGRTMEVEEIAMEADHA